MGWRPPLHPIIGWIRLANKEKAKEAGMINDTTLPFISMLHGMHWDALGICCYLHDTIWYSATAFVCHSNAVNVSTIIYVHVQCTSSNTNLTSISCVWLWLGARDAPAAFQQGAARKFASGQTFTVDVRVASNASNLGTGSQFYQAITATATINRQATIKSGVGDLRPAMASPRHSQSILASGL